MSEKIVICDIDSTMSDHWKRIRRNTVPKWPGGTIDLQAFGREEVMKDFLLPGCMHVLTMLAGKGFYIRYLTARGWLHAKQITMDQLTYWHVPNPQDVILCSNIISKTSILSKETCDYYVDDFMTGQENNIGTFHHGVARAIEAKGIHVIVFRNDWQDVWEQIQLYEQREGKAL